MDIIDKVNKLKNQHLKIALDSILKEVESISGVSNLDQIFKVISDELQKLKINSVFSTLELNKKNLVIKYTSFDSEYSSLFILNQIRKINIERLPNYREVADKKTSVFCKNRINEFREMLPEYSNTISEVREVNAIISPMIIRGEIVGFLEVFSPRLQKNDLSLFNSFSKKLVLRITNSILFYEVKKSEERYKNLFEKAQDGFFILNGRLRKFMNVNKKMCEMSGYTKDEMLQMNYITLFAVEERKKIENIVKQRLQNKEIGSGIPNNYESKIITKNGNIKYIQVSVIQYVNEEEWFTIIRDITGAKIAEEALLESENRYESIFESTVSANIIFDVDVRVLMVNSEFERLTGYSKRDIIGRKWTDFLSNGFSEKIKGYKDLISLNESKEIYEWEFSLQTKDGRKKEVMVRLGFIPGTETRIASLLDITERKCMEKKLKDSEEKHRKLIEEANEAIVVVNIKGYIEFANKVFHKLSGYKKSELSELHLSKFVYTDDLDEVIRRFNLRISGKAVSDSLEFRVMTRSGDIKHISLSSSTVFKDGKIVGVQALVRDITENVELQNKVKKQLEYEKLIADISYKSLRARNVDSFMEKTLKNVGEKINVDRVFIFHLDKPNDELLITYEWSRPNVETKREQIRKIEVNKLEWCMNYISKYKVLKYNDISNIPSENEKSEFLKYGVKSILVLPILTSEGLFGYICGETYIDYVDWDDDQIRLMKVVGNILGQALDISILQDRIMKSREDYKHVIDTIQDGICVVNKNLKIENFNKNFLDNVDFSPYKIKNETFNNVIATYFGGIFQNGSLVTKNKKQNQLLQAFNNGKSISFVEESTDDIGKIFYHRINIYPSKKSDGLVDRIVISICNITKQKTTSEEVRRLSEFNKRILDNVPVSIIVLNKEGEIVLVNNIARSMMRKKEMIAILNRKLIDTPNIKKNDDLVRYYKKLLSQGEPFYYNNMPYSPKGSDRKMYLNITAVPLLNNNGEVDGAISMALDNTEAVYAKQDLENSNRNLERNVLQRTRELNELNKELEKVLELKSKFISDASHELRTPLTIIHGNLDLAIHESRNLSGQVPELYLVVNKEVERMSQILSDLTMLTNADANTERLEYEPVYVDMLVKSIVDSINVLAKQKNIKIKYNNNKFDDLFVKGDESKLEKLLLNIVRNAIKYTEENGLIELFIEKKIKGISITIKDNGIGIPRQDLPYVFERFYRVDKARSRQEGGTGLGLSICKWIVEAHGGSISVDSELGRGTQFVVFLPYDYREKDNESSLF